jgi:hypothetical protein
MRLTSCDLMEALRFRYNISSVNLLIEGTRALGLATIAQVFEVS